MVSFCHARICHFTKDSVYDFSTLHNNKINNFTYTVNTEILNKALQFNVITATDAKINNF